MERLKPQAFVVIHSFIWGPPKRNLSLTSYIVVSEIKSHISNGALLVLPPCSTQVGFGHFINHIFSATASLADN